jgi:tetratricopeptide (TPR) repeat protein
MLTAAEGSQESLHYEFAPPTPVSVAVPDSVMKWATDGASSQPGTMTWTLRGESRGSSDEKQQLIRVQDKLVRDIIVNNKWQRPVYFSSTVGPDAWAGLEEYFKKEAMAYRIMPVKQEQNRSVEPLNYKVTQACLMNTLPADKYSETPQYGFKFRNLTDKSAFFMEDHRRLMLNYRSMYTGLARYELVKNNNPKGTVAALNKLEEVISPDMFAMPYPQSSEISDLYRMAGDKQKSAQYAKRAIATIDALGDEWMNDQYAKNFNPIQIKAQMYANMGDYERAIQTYQTLQQQYPNDPNLRAQIEDLRTEKYLDKKDTAGAVKELEKIIGEYGNVTDQNLKNNLTALQARRAELTHTTVAPPDNTVAAPADSSNKTPAPRTH